ncbi:hypothetical protein ACO2Q2_16010 [Dyella sp. KRB-257]|uniref:hypothetical protein n=1 Tax=Dyella sp. KRB-257 TaxID=3400915 RepID=UPI003C10B5BA
MLESPREAAERARVYRRGTRQKPRDRGLRAVALIGSLLLHLVVLIGAVLGPAYVPPPLPEHPGDALQVRLIEKKKDEPPPPPPVRGTPPKERGPVHRGSAARVAMRTAWADAATPALPAVPAVEPVPVPTLQPPVIDVSRRSSVPAPQKAVAAPPPPLSLPAPAPTPELAPVPLAAAPPTITLDTPPAAKPVPPAFQPEPPRKPQLEGNRPIPPPASLALPELPAQAPPTFAPPTVALDPRVPPAVAPASVVLAHPQVAAAAPPVPELQPMPLPAQAAPQVKLQPQISAPAPIVVATERPRVQAPAITVAAAEPQLEAVPVAPLAPSLIEQPRAPASAAPKLDLPAPAAAIAVARPAIAPAPAAEAPKPAAPATAPAASAAPAIEKSAANQVPASAPVAAEARAADRPSAAVGERDASTAPDATPQGSDTATPGSPTGKEPSTPVIGPDGSLVLPAPGQGTGSSEPAGSTAGNAATGASSGQPGDYIQLKPHGDVQIMEHRAPNLGYKPTRFEQDWAPEGESSIDTALRHAVEKTTMKHTFHLPRGVRIECVAMPLFPMALFGCHNPDPPAKPLTRQIYQRLNLPSVPLAPPPPAPAVSVAKPAAAPILLDNSVQCATARIAGGPLPPGCAATGNAPPKPLATPARASSSWVPASDQFQ